MTLAVTQSVREQHLFLGKTEADDRNAPPQSSIQFNQETVYGRSCDEANRLTRFASEVQKPERFPVGSLVYGSTIGLRLMPPLARMLI
jgi:hypothetical protein